MYKNKKKEKSPHLSHTKQSLRSLNVRPTKTRGQNFVINPNIIKAIIDFGSPKPTENIVEIGPGLGALTDLLHQTNPNLALVEIEEEFCLELQKKYPEIKIFNEDARKFDFNEYSEKLLSGSPITVFGNIPYIFSTEIVFHLLSFPKKINRFVFLLQKEFAQRMSAVPGSKQFGVLSVMVQVICDTRLGPIINGDQFFPPTKVQSQVIECTMRANPLVPIEDHAFFRRVVKASFHQRRKKIANSLLSGGFLKEGVSNKEIVESALERAKIDSGRRAETLSVEEFIMLAKELK